MCVSGVAPRDRSCTRRDRSGGGAVALTRFGGFVATIQCSFRPCSAAAWVSGCWWGLLGDRLVEGGILVVCVSWGWLRGTGPALAGIAREEGLSR